MSVIHIKKIAPAAGIPTTEAKSPRKREETRASRTAADHHDGSDTHISAHVGKALVQVLVERFRRVIR